MTHLALLDINIERTVPSGEVIRRAVCFRSWLRASWSFCATVDHGNTGYMHSRPHLRASWSCKTTVDHSRHQLHLPTNCTLPTAHTHQLHPTDCTYRLHIATRSTEPDRNPISSGSGRDEGQFHCSQVLSPRRTGQNHHFIRFRS